MDVSIRPRSDADLAACVAALRLVHEADDYPMIWPADPVAWLTPPDLAAAWVAVLDDVPLAGHVLLLDSGLPDSGLLVSGPFVSGAGLEPARLFVPPAARRRSVASALLAAVSDFAGPRPLALRVTAEERSAAIALYERLGWQYTHSSVADWTAPDGSPVHLRHYLGNVRS